MSWRVLAVVGCLAFTAPAGAQEESIGTIGFGTDTFEIVHAAAYQGPMPGTIDLEFFNAKLPAGETYFSLDSEATAPLRGMRLRISAEPAYRNGTWLHPSIEGHDAFYYFDADDPIVLTYESDQERIRGSIVGEDRIGSTSTKVNLKFDLLIAAPRE